MKNIYVWRKYRIIFAIKKSAILRFFHRPTIHFQSSSHLKWAIFCLFSCLLLFSFHGDTNPLYNDLYPSRKQTHQVALIFILERKLSFFSKVKNYLIVFCAFYCTLNSLHQILLIYCSTVYTTRWIKCQSILTLDRLNYYPLYLWEILWNRHISTHWRGAHMNLFWWSLFILESKFGHTF